MYYEVTFANTIPTQREIHKRTPTDISRGSSALTEATNGNGAPKRGVPQGIPKKTMNIVMDILNSYYCGPSFDGCISNVWPFVCYS